MDRTKLDEGIAALVAQLDGLDGMDTSAVLYGSAARGDWVPDRSDVNVLLVMEDPSPPSLRRLTPAVTEWHNRGFTPPLIIGRKEWLRAADVFPIEITDMQLAHRVLRGSDPVAGMKVKPGELRRAVESDLRGKLVRLRQAYVRFGESATTLGGFATASVSSFLVLLRCTSVLLERKPGRDPAEVIESLAHELGPDSGTVVDIAAHRREPKWTCPPEIFVRYLEVVRKATDLADHFHHGEH